MPHMGETATPSAATPSAATDPDGPGAGTALFERPQPVGVFPLPAGFLLIPAGPDTARVRHALTAGRLPDAWPERLRAIEFAYRGDARAAVRALDGDDPINRYNRFVLLPPSERAEEPAAVRAALGPDLGALVDVVRFALGELTEPPARGAATGEIAALVHAAQAAHAMAADQPGDAASSLGQAIAEAERAGASGLAAQLLSTTADLRRALEGPTDAVLAGLGAAAAALDGTDLAIARAELRLALGSAHQERAGENPEHLRAAAEQYLAALRLVTVDTAPEVFASAQVNLATAYLAMPMSQASDQLRVGVAIAGLRTALTVYTPRTHPRHWASTQLNLANALVGAPSGHRRGNLVEAVGRFTQVLAVRDPRTDPLGHARALAGQGNALAHLGALDKATGVLTRARAAFERAGATDEANAVRGLLDEVTEGRGHRT
jgi:tetratricopeptide (TPR) repeat protein